MKIHDGFCACRTCELEKSCQACLGGAVEVTLMGAIICLTHIRAIATALQNTFKSSKTLIFLDDYGWDRARVPANQPSGSLAIENAPAHVSHPLTIPALLIGYPPRSEL